MQNSQLGISESGFSDVAAIVTAMTHEERYCIEETVRAVANDGAIAQLILCVESSNYWIEPILSDWLVDSRIEIVRFSMAPPGAIRNQALAYVKLPWVAYCDGDDIWEPNKIAIQRQVANDTGADFVGADHYIANQAGVVCAFALARNLPVTSSWLVRTAVMKQYPFNNTLMIREDGDWWIRTHGKVSKVRCSRILLRYRVRLMSLSSGTRSKQRKIKITTLARYPIIKWIILALTGLIWFAYRCRYYVWLKSWENEQSEAIKKMNLLNEPTTNISGKS
ncbi:MAG: glycosyltransferase family 2 protein [Phormidesmis sp. RL_2_1]|nr:glycosyltransferase family 2 protein [Phormidesmis sp. RL_2_1]